VEESLRYADCPAADVSLVIAASPDDVWRVVTDIQLPARFSDEFQGAEWIDEEHAPAIGARFVGRNHHPAMGGWETTSTVVALDAPRCFGWAVGDPNDPSATWRFELAPVEGGTRLTQRMQMGPARSGINIAIDRMPDKESRILARRLDEHRANMLRTLEGIKALVEHPS
jgi:uncharacterized protein YndB with AHSA1/START domain